MCREVIAARQRHHEVCFLFDDVINRAGIRTAVADTDKYLLAHLGFLLLGTFRLLLADADYTAHRSAGSTFALRSEQVAVRRAIHTRTAACVLYEQQLDVVVIADILRHLVLRVTCRSLHMDIPAIRQQAAHVTASAIRLVERSVHLAVLDCQLPAGNNIL